MQLKHKIVALGILPLLLAVAVICALVSVQNQRLGEQQVRLIENAILASKRAELQNYVAMTLSVIAPLHAGGRGDAQAQQQALDALAKISFGADGYFFVYDAKGRNLMHPRQAELVGKDLWGMTDAHGLPAVQALLESAARGDGFQRYAWRKPSSGREADKLAYVTMLEGWGWMLGTGIYLEEVEQATRLVRAEVADGIFTTMVAIASVALIAVLLVFSGGLTLSVREHRLADSKLQALNQRILSLQEEERSRVSRELHDGISQLLVSIKFQLELAAHQLEAGASGGPPKQRQRKARRTRARSRKPWRKVFAAPRAKRPRPPTVSRRRRVPRPRGPSTAPGKLRVRSRKKAGRPLSPQGKRSIGPMSRSSAPRRPARKKRKKQPRPRAKRWTRPPRPCAMRRARQRMRLTNQPRPSSAPHAPRARKSRSGGHCSIAGAGARQRCTKADKAPTSGICTSRRPFSTNSMTLSRASRDSARLTLSSVMPR